ncbi:MAG: PmbA protein [Chloroflexota bacterium]|nr:PmbA protein [Chloroflexota bacterium]
MLGEVQLRQLTERALGASSADETEVLVIADESALTRFANSAIHQNVFESGIEIRVRAVLGTRIGVATTNSTDERALREVVERAVVSARLAPETPDFRSLPGPQPIPQAATFSGATAVYTPERRARDVKAVCDEAISNGLEASGAWSMSQSEVAVANSRGVWAFNARTHASFKTVIMGPTSSGYAERDGLDATAIDVGAAGREAIDKAVRSRDPIAIEPGDYTVVLEPYAVGTMLDYFGGIGLGALAVQEGRSFMNDHFGERLLGPNVTLWDDGLDPRGAPMPFDFEGVPKQRVTFFEKGVARDVVYDSYTAGRENRHSTGHGLPAPNSWGPVPLNMFLGEGDASRDDLVRGVERGLWVTRFHYVNVVHPTKAILTGMTRDGTFLIERGEITRPVHNLRFTQSVLEALSCVEAIGRDAMMLQDEWSGTHVPALRISRFSFSSATEF